MKTKAYLNYIFGIICAIVIVAGMTVGTICHFFAGGFFNYGSEFSSYTSVVVTYSTAEYAGDAKIEQLKANCDEKLAGFSCYEFSMGEKLTGGELVYKYSADVDGQALAKAVEEINATIDPGDSGLNYAVVHSDSRTFVGGSKVIIFASVAISCGIVFQFIYFIFRYKLRSALTALLSGVVNLGLFVSLVAITRLPVGAELIALSAAVVLLTMIGSCVFLDRAKKNFRKEKKKKTDRADVVAVSGSESRKINLVTVLALAVAVIVLALCGIIAFAGVTVLVPYAVTILGLASCCFGTLAVMPAAHTFFDGVCEAAKNSVKSAALNDKSATRK